MCEMKICDLFINIEFLNKEYQKLLDLKKKWHFTNNLNFLWDLLMAFFAFEYCKIRKSRKHVESI